MYGECGLHALCEKTCTRDTETTLIAIASLHIINF